MEVLLEATSVDDMLSRYDFLNSIANQDLSVFKEMKDLRREITVRQRDLEDQQTRQQQAVAQTQQKQAEMQASLVAQESLLASVNTEVQQLLAQSGTTLSDGTTSTTVTITGPFAFPARGAHTFSNDWHAPRTGHLHQGCDIMATMGCPAVACVNGTITVVTEGGNAGKYLRLTMDGSATFFYYMHMQDIVVSVGQKVKAGDLVGHVGDTGNARGGPAHIHFEVHPGAGRPSTPTPPQAVRPLSRPSTVVASCWSEATRMQSSHFPLCDMLIDQGGTVRNHRSRQVEEEAHQPVVSSRDEHHLAPHKRAQGFLHYFVRVHPHPLRYM